MVDKPPLNIRWTLLTVLFILLIYMGHDIYERQQGPLTAPAPMATWPWPHPVITNPHPGVTVWTDRSSPYGDIVRLIRFDFDTNAHLRFAIYDQDSDDSHPHDDSVDFWPTGVAQATAHLNSQLQSASRHPIIAERSASDQGRQDHGVVVAACNGLFFGSDYGPVNGVIPPHGTAHHVTATVDNGVVRYNVGAHRWTFGASYSANSTSRAPHSSFPAFNVVHEPDRATLASTFTYAAGGAQCLIHDGKPLKLTPFPGSVDVIDPLGAPSTPDEAGHIPLVDHIKTSRISFGWSRDSRQLYLLFVRQHGSEGDSVVAFRERALGSPAESRVRMLSLGGWDIADEQRFWQKLGVWGAINDDGGDPAQLALIEADGRYQVNPADWASTVEEIDDVDLSRSTPETTALPQGGSLMYFYIYDSFPSSVR